MRAEVYSWRVSSELKSDLEREARARKMSISSILDIATREWLKKSAGGASEEEMQRTLHAAAERCLGTLSSGNLRRSETARKSIRERLARRYAR